MVLVLKNLTLCLKKNLTQIINLALTKNQLPIIGGRAGKRWIDAVPISSCQMPRFSCPCRKSSAARLLVAGRRAGGDGASRLEGGCGACCRVAPAGRRQPSSRVGGRWATGSAGQAVRGSPLRSPVPLCVQERWPFFFYDGID